MPRQKLSEYRSKNIVAKQLELPYVGWSVDSSMPLENQLSKVASPNGKFVVKVDEGVKKRFKNGLVILNVNQTDLISSIKTLVSKGYNWLIVEPMFEHNSADERYLSITSDRDEVFLNYTTHGGVDVEEHAQEIISTKIGESINWSDLAKETALKEDYLKGLVKVFNDNFLTLLEINPYVVSDDGVHILDIAIEVDDAGAFFVEEWGEKDLRQHSNHNITPEEQTVEELNTKSPASFKLNLLNPDGGIFLLLSGGGASVVVADEVYNKKFGTNLANYGEYSGNPNTEETYTYTKAVLSLLLASKAPKKMLFIGGAVANFTDVAKTFQGVIQAINEVAEKLKNQDVKVFVRRGGPNEKAGLAMINEALTKAGLLGVVHDSSVSITGAVDEALEEFSRGQ